ncbi:FimV family protein [Kineobactrum sediminis]|nr:FimV family protein [Kineobactrum sediminis]
MVHKRKLAAALVSWSCMQAGSVWGLGLGELTLESFLNEPLKARVSLLDVGDLHEDQIRVRLATTEDFDRLGVDRAYFLTGIKFDIELDDNGRGAILLRSDDPVLEPFLDFIVETRWPSGRVLRNYTVLVDPPVFDRSSPTASASERVAAAEGSPEPTAEKKKADVSTGTRVETRRSELAPGAMPQRDFGADAAARAAPGSRYMIRRDDTLWAIAQQARPEGVSVHQTMLEIQRLNPEAFLGGNINRIKAGYIIYLPASNDIGSADLEAALAEVRQQNEDWRAGRSSTPAGEGPALRISSADVTPAANPGEPAQDSPAERPAPAGAGTSAANAAMEGLEKSEREREELGQRLQALSERLETLERIVELKDARIASLQQDLAAAGSGEAPAAGAGDQDPPAVASTAETLPAPVISQPRAPTPPPAEGGNWFYALVAAVVAALLGLLLWRRRSSAAQAGTDDYSGPAAAFSNDPGQDEFADVQLRDQALVEDADGAVPAFAPAAAFTPESPVPQPSGERGYGERKHDEYASDVEAGGALAEVDIYIAYGRFSQAMELLRNALRSEPENTAYRLKLLELAVETADRAEADLQLGELRRIGDQDAIARGESLISAGSAAAVAPERRFIDEPAASDDQSESLADSQFSGNLSDFEDAGAESAVDTEDDLSLELDDVQPADARDELVPSVGDSDLSDSDFLGLELEEDLPDDLIVSAEATPRATADAADDEDDFVFAEDGDPLSTKLDLARAYIDMGDDDGARQILAEVVADGSAEQQQEARELLGRLG